MNYYSSDVARSTATGPTFSLATLLLVMTICSVWLAIFVVEPFFALLTIIPFTFAFLRTQAGVRVRRRAGTATPSGKKVELFITSTCLGLLICFLSLVVGVISLGFLAVSGEIVESLSGEGHSDSFWLVIVGVLGMLACVVAMQITAIHFIWSTWPRRFDAAEDKFY